MCGKASCSPFDAAVVTKVREQLLEKLNASGIGATRQATDEPSSLHFRLVYALLKPFEDPDACATGFRVGVGIWMPRTPAVYGPKHSWRLSRQRDPELYLHEETGHGTFHQNFKSAVELERAVEKELDASVIAGKALKMSESEARARFGPDLVVASLGALVKDGAGDDVKIRLLYDGTHGVQVNERIRVRDRDRMPSAPDVKREAH